MIKVSRVLTDRLHAKMFVQEGLLNEIKELRAIASSSACTSSDAVAAGSSDESAEQQTDYTVGIYQSIGEF
jgi:tRNA dimethylallyltransferase